MGLRIEPEILSWLKDALRESLEEAGQIKAMQLERLEAERVTLRKRLEQLYADKISGDVPASVYPTLKERWESELAEVDVAIRAAEAADSSYYDEGVALLELAQNAHLEFKTADSDDRRELLRYLGSNFKIVDGKVVVELRNSFKTMFEANQQVAGMAPNAMQSEIWSG
ncbi:MAG TPA: hypothetical protein VHE55_09305 [Fimbriimonadaceae bacterium]|nr:hypothetical protein [Fimbriimonadaceae bacterium]